MAGKYKIVIEQGATFALPIQWRNGDTPVNLLGATGRMQIRATVISPDVLWEMNAANNGVSIQGNAIVLNISATDTASFKWRSGVYDLEIKFPNGFVKRLLEGTVAVIPEVTR